MPDVLLVSYAMVLIFVNCCLWQTAAFVAVPMPSSSSSSSSSSGTGTGTGSAASANAFQTPMASGLMAFPVAAYMNSVGDTDAGADADAYADTSSTENLLFQPRDSVELNERVVYDPGDELFRALNGEMVAKGHQFGHGPDTAGYADYVRNVNEMRTQQDVLKKLEADLREEQEFVDKSALLMKLLEDPTIETLPVIYVEDSPIEDPSTFPTFNAATISKRSRFYRRYPFKRQNKIPNYEPQIRFACTPSKLDIFKLLVKLHDNRGESFTNTVKFCNRKRPAKTVFTNIRFVG